MNDLVDSNIIRSLRLFTQASPVPEDMITIVDERVPAGSNLSKPETGLDDLCGCLVFAPSGFRIPTFFLEMFEYVTELSSAPRSEVVEKGIARLVEMRHESIYAGYGYDDVAFCDLMNADDSYAWRLGEKSAGFRRFAVGLIGSCAEAIEELRNGVLPRDWSEVKPYLRGSIMAPPFEMEGSPSVSDEYLDGMLSALDEWVFKD